MRWGRIIICVLAVALGATVAAVAAGAGGANNPLVELHLDTLVTTGYSPDGTTPAGTTPDSSGDGLTASFSGTPISDGRFAGGLDMGYPDNGVTVPDTALLRPAGGVTVMAWVRDQFYPGEYRLVLGKADAPACRTLSYGLLTGPHDGLGFNLRTQGAGGDTSYVTAESDPAALWDGHWHAVAGTYDGNTMSLWIDGVQTESRAIGSHPIAYGTTDPSHSGLYAGLASAPAGCSGANGYADSGFSGDVDELRVYDHALSASEIAALQSPTATTPPELPPATTSTTTPTTTSTTTPAPPAPTTTTATTPTAPPVASFTAPASAPAFGRIILNASATSGATKLMWDVNGDGHTDFIRSPTQSVLGIRFPRPITLHVKLTAIGVGGASSTATHTVTITGRQPSPALYNRIGPVVTSISGTPGFFSGLLTCAVNSRTLTFGLAEAEGCFDEVSDVDKVPLLERRVVDDHYESTKVSAVVTRLCRLAAEGKKPQSLCDDAKKFFPDASLDVFVSHHAVKINGISIDPIGPASVVVYPSLQRVISSAAIIKWGNIPVDVGQVDWDLHNQTVRVLGSNNPFEHPLPPEGRATLLSFDLHNLGDIAGFHPQGQVALSLETVDGKYASTGSVDLTLPSEFSVFGGQAPSAAVKLAATNDDNGPIFDHLDLQVPRANLGAVTLTNVRFRYERGGHIDNDFNPGTACPRDEWKATANIFISGDATGATDGRAGLLLSPPPSQNGVEFCNGGFKGAGGDLHFGEPIPPPQVFPGVFLDDVNFAVQLNPTLVRGGVSLSAAELSRISGTLLAVFATPWQPYVLDRQDAGADLQDLVGRRFTSTSFAVGGALTIHVPGVGDLDIAHGGAAYSYPDYIGLGAKVNTQLGIFVFDGSVGAQFNIARRLFEADVSAKLCVRGFKIACAGGLLVASEKGAVACLELGPLHPGVGVMTNGQVELWLYDGCKPSHYWSAGRGAGFGRSARFGALAAPAAGATTVTVARGETVKNIKLAGLGGAPHVLVQGPGGARLTVAGDGLSTGAGGSLAAISSDRYSTTWLGIGHGRPGRYTITPLPGSPSIVRVEATRPGYDTDFAARVTGHGAERVLHYDARRRGGGQRVTFYEDGGDVMRPLATATGGRGTVRFAPAAGAGGTRTIVARATVDGSPIRSQTLARFHVAATRRAGRPGRVTVRRRGTRLTVGWGAAPGARRYAVVLRLADGSTRALKPSARRTRVIRGVPKELGGSVRVSAQGVLGDWGRPRAMSFARLRAPFTVVQTNRRNEKRRRRRRS